MLFDSVRKLKHNSEALRLPTLTREYSRARLGHGYDLASERGDKSALGDVSIQRFWRSNTNLSSARIALGAQYTRIEHR